MKTKLLKLKPMQSLEDEQVFIQDINQVDVWCKKNIDNECNLSATVALKWRYDVEIKSNRQGIKGFHVYTIQAQVIVINKDTDKVMDIIDTELHKDWSLTDEHVDLRFDIKPLHCSVDYNDRSIIIGW